MKLPKKIRIGYLDYAVKEMPLAVPHEGDCYSHTRTIRVRTKRRPEPFVANTLLHEIFHGIFYTSGLHNVPGLGDDVEEMVVTCLANGLSQVLRDNPEIKKLLRQMR
jgi:hypothetical protein